MANPTALSGKNSVVPLPFNPSSLKGLSERLITSHHENNYGGAVKNLNRVEQELAAIKADTPPFLVAALRERELTFRNSKTLHEAYFANLLDSGALRTVWYGEQHAQYIDAFFANVRWDEVNRRFENAQRAAAAFRGAG